MTGIFPLWKGMGKEVEMAAVFTANTMISAMSRSFPAVPLATVFLILISLEWVGSIRHFWHASIGCSWSISTNARNLWCSFFSKQCHLHCEHQHRANSHHGGVTVFKIEPIWQFLYFPETDISWGFFQSLESFQGLIVTPWIFKYLIPHRCVDFRAVFRILDVTDA